MTTKTLLLSTLLALGLATTGCGGDGDSNGGASSTPDATSGAASGDTSATSAPAETKTYDSHGVVTKVDAERGRVTLDHEKIGDWMEPMEMPFKVADASMLEGLEVGKRYAFTVEVAGETSYQITKLTPVQ